jgi:spore maturation protein CgeB
LRDLKIPYVSWFGDNPFHFIKPEYISPYYKVFVWDRTYIPKLKEFGLENSFYLPLCTNPDRFHKIERNEEIKRYETNISFVGSSFYSHYEKYKEIRHPLLKAMIDEVVTIQSKDPFLDISTIITEVEGKYSCKLNFKESEDKVKISLEYAAMAKYRKEVIEEVADLGISIYGDDRWENLVEKRDGVKFSGWVDPERRLPLIYNASKINLNITKSQARTGLNWRVFDVLACCGFLLSDYRKDLEELFILDEEVVAFRDKDGVFERAVYFLEDPKERRSVAEKGRARVLREHTFKARMERVLEIMEGTL